MELRDTFETPDIHIIATCSVCDETWDVDYDPIPCECEDSEWFVRSVEYR